MVARVALRLVASPADELDEVIVDALRTIGGLEGADRAYITMLDDDGAQFRNSHEWCAPGIESQQTAIGTLPTADFPWSLALALGGSVLNVGSLDELPPEASAEHASFGRFGVRSILQIPMPVNGRLRGIVGFNHVREARDWSTSTIELVESIAGAIAVALLRRDADLEVRRARDEAERAARTKDELLSRVSHELRTPLHAILGFAELVRLEQLSTAARASLDQIEVSGRRLLRLVDDLLQIGMIASGGLQASLGPVPLRFAIDDALVEQRSVAATRGVRMVLGPGVDGVVVRADPGLLAHVIDGLVSNALQHGSSGRVVEIDAERVGADCRITVRDEGPGLAADEIDQAFTTFTRLGAERAGEPGMGVGLTVVRSLAESMNGAVHLESTPGVGTTAVVVLPLALDV
ncbi:MAG: GAF domain-containing sensor histidine kinase [Ilumatobacteraceae bacterium]